jgi:hypothetical protein
MPPLEVDPFALQQKLPDGEELLRQLIAFIVRQM